LVEEVAGNVGQEAKVAKINVDDNNALGPRFGVRGIPAILIFKNGQVVDQLRPGDDLEGRLLAQK
jgi:thioredoxin 1